MNKYSLASPTSFLVLTSIILASSGCAVQSIGGFEPGGSGGGGSGETTAIAILGSEMPHDNVGYLGLAQLDVQPDSLYVFIGNFGESCSSPFPPACEDDVPLGENVDEWQVIVGIPASLQQQGVLSLPGEAGVASVASIGATGNSTGECGSGPNGLTGDVDIASIDATQVTLHFMDVQPTISSPQGPPLHMTAEYTASRCPSTAP
jgi:hypothetical protein